MGHGGEVRMGQRPEAVVGDQRGDNGTWRRWARRTGLRRREADGGMIRVGMEEVKRKKREGRAGQERMNGQIERVQGAPQKGDKALRQGSVSKREAATKVKRDEGDKRTG